MNKLLLSILIVLLSISISRLWAQDKTCLNKALDMLKKSDKNAYEVYTKTSNDSFSVWLNCSMPAYALSLAVHETVHMLGLSKSNAYEHFYYLPGGEMISVPRKNLFPREELVQYLKTEDKDSFYHSYLTGMSAKQDLLLVLDEMNAYTHSVYTEVNLYKYYPAGVKSATRDGLGTFMWYLELYLRHARTIKPSDYDLIRSDSAYLSAIKRLWENAEDSLLKSAPCKGLGIYDRYKLKLVYDAANINEMKLLFENAAESPVFRSDIVAKFNLKAALSKSEIPKQMDPKKQMGITATMFMINGKKYTCPELEEAAKNDSMLKGAYETLKNNGICK